MVQQAGQTALDVLVLLAEGLTVARTGLIAEFERNIEVVVVCFDTGMGLAVGLNQEDIGLSRVRN